MTISVEAKRRALLERRMRDRQAAKSMHDRVTPVQREGRLPCSYQQEGLWILQQLDPTSSVYHVTYASRLLGRLDVDALRTALTALVARHESLRTRFGSDDGVPYQIIDPPPATFALSVIELGGDVVLDWVRAESHRPFDLAAEPGFRVALARVAPDEHVLLMVPHHIIVDGWSMAVAAKELSALYRAAKAGTAAVLAESDIQPADHAAWQRRWLSGTQMEAQVGFWRDTLAGVPALEFPTDRPRPAQPTGAGALFYTSLGEGLGTRLQEMARREQASYLAVLLAGFLTVLNRYTGQEDLAVGSVFSGRTFSEIEPLVGFFANTLVLRTSLAGNPTFRELVGRCNDTVLSATAHQDVPFGVVVDACKPERVSGRNPLFQVSLTLQPAAVADDGLAFDDVVVTPFDMSEISWGRSRFDLAMGTSERADGGLDVFIEHSTELFDHQRMERFIEHFRVALTEAVSNPDTQVGDIDLTGESERRQVLLDWNPAATPRPHRLLHEMPAGNPDDVAMRFAGADLSYAELDARSNRLAHLLISSGAAPGDIVAMLLERGFDLPVAELGVLKAGCAWLPLDPQYPAERLAFQLSDANVSLTVTTKDLAGLLPTGVGRILLDSSTVGAYPDTAPDVEIGPEDVAYVIYTSGSTGRPKGVMVPHRAAVHFCHNLVELFSLSPSDRVLQFSNPTFDVSVSDFHATFAAGATVVGAPRERLLNPDTLQILMRDERITFADIPPVVLRLLDPEPLTDLRVLFIGMEPFGAELVNNWARPGREFHNGYGPTEVTITCTDYKCPPEPLTASPPIGRAMANHRAYILDNHLRPVPVEVPGELYMAGAGLAHGYLGRPDLTAEKFLPDPFGPEPGERMYATGDLARWNANGQIVFIGRADRQVKIRGLRIELGEIEHAVNSHPGVRQCVVMVREPGTSEAYLAAYVVPQGTGVGADELRQYLADRLPRHMIPALVVSLAELPLTSAGKLDTARLLALGSRQSAVHIRPRTDAQRRLAEMWHVLLRIDVDQIGIHDNFFVLGGSSLQAAQLISRIQEEFGVTLDLRVLFANPVLEPLAAKLDQPEKDDRLPCTYQQEGMWFLHQLDPDSTVYHMPFACRIRGQLDVDVLQGALTAMAARHESLRTRFEDVDGQPFQVIDPAPEVWPLPVIQLADEDAVTRWVHDEWSRPIALDAGPVFRSALARISPTDHVLLLVSHHIITDSWSAGLLTSELSEVYDAARWGLSTAPAGLTTQPKDHAVWQRRWLAGEVLDEQVSYWRKALAGIEILEFPTDRPRPALPTGAGALLVHRMPDGVCAEVRDFASDERVSILAVLLAGFLAVLHRYTGQDDLAIGSVFPGRTNSELEPLAGSFASTLVLRTQLSGQPSFTELVHRCHSTVSDATAHQEVPFGLVVNALKPARIPGRNPLFQVCFSLQTGSVGPAIMRLGNTWIEPVETSSERSRFDMTLTVSDNDDGTMDLTAEYSTELFDTGSVERLAVHLDKVLSHAVSTPDNAIDSLGLMSDAEIAAVIENFNPMPVERPAGLMQDFVTRWAAQTPDKEAMRFEGRALTYSELEVRSNRLAHLLIDSYRVAPGSVVGMLLERGLDLQVAQLGVLKTGCAWMPLDAQHPVKRIAYQVHDANVPVVITTSDIADLLPPDVPRILLDKGYPEEGTDTPPAVDIRPEDVAYVMYTSGSTGAPKGVMVPHRAAVQYALSTAELFAITPDDRLSQVANPAFDVSIFDTYAAFAAGATGIGAARSTILDPDALGALLRDERVTVSYVPPSLLSLVDPQVPRDLRVMMVAGETCSAELANRWSRPGREFHNGYGPTETTVTCTNYLCPTKPMDELPPIGPPMANQRAYVLDMHLRPVPIGAAGQLYMAGAGLARGYLGRPDLTAEKWLPDPFAREPGERMYATGDVVRWRADGNLEFLGRVDRQIQLRGLRIELGEIEHALAGFPGVRQSVVVVGESGTSEAYLIGYVVLESGSALDLDKIRQVLVDQLPLHMVPGIIMILPELPLTSNGKVDRARLPMPEPESGAGYEPPGTDTERELAYIWQTLLKFDAGQIGLRDNFFNLGGNSLQSTQLISRIRDQFYVTLHPRTLLTHPTLGQLAACVDEEFRLVHLSEEAPEAETVVPHWTVSPVVPLNTAGSQPPLFFVHAVGGSVAPYIALAALLGADQPFYGIEDLGLRGGGTGAESTHEIAAGYLSAIREVQAEGPFHLGGWSFGGLVALEMAQQLQAAGQEVAVVVLLDSGLMDKDDTIDGLDHAVMLTWFADDFTGMSGMDKLPFDLAELRALSDVQQVDAVLDALSGMGSDWNSEDLRNRINVFSANSRAFLGYQPSPFRGRLALISAADEADDSLDRWRALALNGFAHHVVPGNHYSLLRAPHLTSVAEAIRLCLGSDPIADQ